MARNKEELRKWQRAYEKRRSQELRNQIFDALGPFCVCCGEEEKTFLTIDHIGGGGIAHRKSAGCSRHYYLQMIKEGLPKEKYRILCWNCNSATRWGRICPHQLKGAFPSE